MSDNSFAVYVLEQLADCPGISSRKMFGGVGLYCNGTFFGIISDDVFYIKTNAQTRDEYIKRGMKPFCPSAKQTLKNYYEVPAEIIDDRNELRVWVLRSIQCLS